VVFSCYPAGVGINPIAFLIKAGIKVIDLSADFRLSSAALYKSWYKITHTAKALLPKAVYGLPELFRKEIVQASLVANPGCYATAAILAAAPLLKANLVHPDSLIVDAKSGVSGAGKKVALAYTYNEVDENLTAYNVASHRHQPEIEQTLSRVRKGPVRLTFTPHLIPMKRGILSVLYATLKKPMKTADVISLFKKQYEGEPFIRVLPEGELPQTKNVTNSNYCDIGITQDVRLRRIIVLSALDNLVKGAAGQAIQNMNLVFDRQETEGLL
jgi:N-acetyl-gamma-glutamyl-phosphate reductase